MLPASVPLLAAEEAPSPSAQTPPGDWLAFASHLARQHAIKGDLLAQGDPAMRSKERKLRDLFELTELSASDFADEVSRFFKLPRLDLAQLLAATSLAAKFSRRFLREMTILPCQ